MIFEEEKSWDWGPNYKEQIDADFVWSNDDLSSDESKGGHIGETNGESDDGNNDNEESPHENVTQGRERRAPLWMEDYVRGDELSEEEEAETYMVEDDIGDDPILFEEAVKHDKWRKAMDSEIKSIEKNQTWELLDLPTWAKIIGVKWIFKTKLNEKGEVNKYKARLVAKGYSQQYRIDFTEVFAYVTRMDTIRMIVALAVCKGWDIFQLDVKSAFLHRELKEDVYVHQPEGYVKKGKEPKVYKLHKALYGLKQALNAWFSRIESQFVKEGFQKCPNEQTLFIKRSTGGNILVVSIYVDDLIYTGDDKGMMVEFKRSMMEAFDMSDLGKMRFFLGIEILQKPKGIFICQRKYATDILKFTMSESKPVNSPVVPGFKINRDVNGIVVNDTYFKQIVGSLMYLTATRPDIMFSVSLISRYMSKPTELHLQAAKRILRYLKGTTNYGIFYKKGGEKTCLLLRILIMQEMKKILKAHQVMIFY